jgi:D-methionine transport system ATP-binding protein
VDISEKAKSYPAELSGGQKQRVAIARALASSPKYLLCDEATSALDPQTTESVLELLKRINQTLNVTIIVITHEMKVVEKICSKVAVVYNGSVIENDYVSNVFSDPKSDVSKQLIMPDLSRAIAENPNETKLRLIFEGKTAETAVISTLALKTGIPVNVSYADTKLYDGKLYGRMLITFPNDEDVLEKVTSYLNKVSVTFKKEL